MKNMIKRLMALAAALTIVLSLAAVTGSAAYTCDKDDEIITTFSDRPSDNSNRN